MTIYHMYHWAREGNFIFQPLIFRGENVSFREGIYHHCRLWLGFMQYKKCKDSSDKEWMWHGFLTQQSNLQQPKTTENITDIAKPTILQYRYPNPNYCIFLDKNFKTTVSSFFGQGTLRQVCRSCRICSSFRETESTSLLTPPKTNMEREISYLEKDDIPIKNQCF